MMAKVLINGQSEQLLSTADRGLSYGDGLFETIQIADGAPLLWDAHLQRMQRGAEKLKIPFDDTLADLFYREFLSLLDSTSANAVLKLTLTRGVGKRGYKPDPRAAITRICSLTALPDFTAQQRLGIKVRLCQLQLARQPVLAGLKHLNRLEQVLARSEWDDPDITEGLVCDTDSYLIEGTMSNLFWVTNGVLYTPDLSYSGVEGVIRNALISLCRQKTQLEVKTAAYKLPQLLAADEVFVCNSVINILPVIKLLVDDKGLASMDYQVGPVTVRLQKMLHNLYLKDALN
ncbi:MAG: aminodeoxychorismate lyase [Pseudomonadales bacterium]|nr:aminodeoxychorismate lyase [Pseudomonadales bacterium]